ncbi:hypothetical protein N665_0406s0005 [Sinapis alba]|nr:hypothetical protein N665_0406s0005 [Sinapis alba]
MEDKSQSSNKQSCESLKLKCRLFRKLSHSKTLKQLKRLFRTDLTIAKWARTGHIPNFDEYMEVGLVTGGVHTLLAIAFVGNGKINEMVRGEIATGVNCYMKQYGVTEKEAFLEFDRKVKHVSKQLNEEFLRESGVVPLQLLRVALNFGSAIDVNYKYGDGYTYIEMMRGSITSVFLDLVTL